MELRLRSLQSEETLKLEVPDEFSIQQLKESVPDGKDELSSPSPGDSLISTGVTSGDLVYYEFSSSSTQQGNVLSDLQDSITCNPIIDVKLKPCEFYEQSDVVSLIPPNQQNELLRTKGKGILIGDFPLHIKDLMDIESFDFYTGSDGKRLSELYFLKRIFCEDIGDDFIDTKLVFLAIHAVMLETGFVGLDWMTGLRVDLFDIMKEQPSTTFTTSVSYTLPDLLSMDDDRESIVLKFQTLGPYVNVYGSLGKSPESRVHRLNIDKARYVPSIGSFWATDHGRARRNEIGSIIAYVEKVIFEFWKVVKDGLALPLLMDLCEKTGLDLPLCFIRLPAGIKLQILKLLPGKDVARVACVSKEMSELSSDSELWKVKYMSEFGSKTGAVLSNTRNWKAMFIYLWKKTKRKRGGGSFGISKPFLPKPGVYWSP